MVHEFVIETKTHKLFCFEQAPDNFIFNNRNPNFG